MNIPSIKKWLEKYGLALGVLFSGIPFYPTMPFYNMPISLFFFLLFMIALFSIEDDE